MRTFSVNVNDYNQDSRDDVMIVRHNPQQCCPEPRLYRNDGGVFTQHPQVLGQTDKHDCDWADFNHDGLPDFFCAVGLGTTSVNQLWKQRPDRTFVNVAGAQGLTSPTNGRYRTASFIDANGDGWKDIYVTRYTGPGTVRGYPGDDFPNELWINDAGTGFHLAPGWGLNVKDGARKDADACNEARDYNGDGREDLIVCGLFGFRLYENTGSQFVNVASAKEVGGDFFDAEWADFNGDGLLDIVQVNNDLVRVKLQGADGQFTLSFSQAVAAGNNIGVADVNGDGALDVWVVGSCYAGTIRDNPDYLLLNTGLGVFTSYDQPGLGRQGCGDSASSRLDYNSDGRGDFVVTNGRRTRYGPVQLFTWGGAF